MLDIAPKIQSRVLYLQVRDVLVRRIADGEHAPGSYLPNENMLASSFGVSVGTVRKALGVMEDEHLITRRQGRGTIVNDFISKPLVFTPIVGPDGRRLIEEKRAKTISRAPATQLQADRLQLDVGDELIRVERVRYNDGKPFLTEVTSLPAQLFKRLPSDLASYTLSALALENALIASCSAEAIMPATASEQDAKDLEVLVGTPLLSLDRLILSDQGVPLEWRTAKCILRSERMTVRFR